MKHYGLNIAEGSEITNITAPTGLTDPTTAPNAGELFFRTDLGKLRVHDGTGWISLLGTGDGLANIVEDLSPQLGANLDLNTFGILAGNGTLINPPYSFTSFTNAGMFYDSSVSELALVNGGNKIIGITNSSTSFYTFSGGVALTLSAGTVGAPNQDLFLVGGSGSFDATRSYIQLGNGSGTLIKAKDAASTTTAGFDINLTATAGGSVSGDGGDIILTPGSQTSGSEGAVQIIATGVPTVTTNKLYNSGGTLFWNGIDLTAGGSSFPLLATPAGSAPAPSYSFSGDTNTGMYSDIADFINFATAGVNRFQIESNGTLNVVGTANYELLVTADDDIPNKKYVDDVFGGANNIEYTYTATAGQTIFTGADDNSNTLAYSVGFVEVHLNGSKLVSTDFTATNGTSLVLNTGAIVGDSVVINVTNVLRAFADSTIDNAIINGNFDIWQRGTSLASGTGNRYLSDRWQNSSSGSTYTASRQAFTLGQTAVPNNPKYFHRQVATSVVGINNFALLQQRIEDVSTFSNEEITVSFWAKSGAAKNIATEFVQFFGTGGAPSADVNAIGVTTHALTTSWQKFTVTTTIPSISGKALGTNNDDVLVLNFWFDGGSSFDSRTNTLGQQSGTFDIAQVQIEKGAFATQFERNSISEILDKCQRYYQKSYNLNDVPGTSFIDSSNTIQVSWKASGANLIGGNSFIFKTVMRAIPTLTFYDVKGNVGKLTVLGTAGAETHNQLANFTVIRENFINIRIFNQASSGIAYMFTVDAEL